MEDKRSGHHRSTHRFVSLPLLPVPFYLSSVSPGLRVPWAHRRDSSLRYLWTCCWYRFPSPWSSSPGCPAVPTPNATTRRSSGSTAADVAVASLAHRSGPSFFFAPCKDAGHRPLSLDHQHQQHQLRRHCSTNHLDWDAPPCWSPGPPDPGGPALLSLHLACPLHGYHHPHRTTGDRSTNPRKRRSMCWTVCWKVA